MGKEHTIPFDVRQLEHGVQDTHVVPLPVELSESFSWVAQLHAGQVGHMVYTVAVSSY